MQQPNKGIISPGLKGLMLVQEGLRQLKEGQVSPQGPAGPTLAMQMAQAAAPQVAQGGAPPEPSMAPPPLGQEPEGEIANVAQNAGLGAAIQGQQQQQAQQAMMRMAQQQQAQQQPAMMAGGGIAGLRADNMSHFKEGGVLGFAGKNDEVGSKVPGPDEMAQGEYDTENTGATKKDLKRIAAQAATPLAMVGDLGLLPFDAALKYLLPNSPLTGKNAQLMPATNYLHEAIMANQPDRAAPAAEDAEVAKAYQDPSRQREGDTTATAYQDQSRAKDVLQKVGIATPRPSPTGGRPPAPTPAPPPAPIPSLASQANEAMGLAKPMVNPDQDKAREAVEEAVKARQAQGVPGGVHLQALLDAQQKRARLSEQDEAGAGGRGLAALFQGMMGRNEGASVAAHNEREKQRRRLDIAETLADKEKESAIRDVQAATATGNAEKKAAAYEKLATITQESQKIQAQLAGQILGLAGTNVTAAANLESQRLSNVSHEKIAAMQRAQAAMQHSLPSYEQQLVERLVKDQVANGIPELAAREAVYKAIGKGNYAQEMRADTAQQLADTKKLEAWNNQIENMREAAAIGTDPVKRAAFEQRRARELGIPSNTGAASNSGFAAADAILNKGK